LSYTSLVMGSWSRCATQAKEYEVQRMGLPVKSALCWGGVVV
jgi:hypothetical protein